VSLGLTGPSMTSHAVDNTAKVLAFHRWGAGPNDQVMVVMNFCNKAITNYVRKRISCQRPMVCEFEFGLGQFTVPTSKTRAMGSCRYPATAVRLQSAVTACRFFHARRCRNWTRDSDGLTNGWEQQHFASPINRCVATADDDLDGS